MPSENGSRRRHAKQSFLSKKTEPPPILPITSRHSSCGGNSNAQSTSRSIFHSSLRPSKRPTADVRPTHSQEQAQTKHVNQPEEKKDVDVFAFMEREDDPWRDRQSQEIELHDESDAEDKSPTILTARQIEPPQISPRYSDLEVRTIQDGVQRAWGRASLHSDSGISMHSGSPDPESPILQHKYAMVREDAPDILESTIEEDEPRVIERQETADGAEDQRTFTDRHWPSSQSNRPDVPEAWQICPRQKAQTSLPYQQTQMPEMPTRPVNHLVHQRPRPVESTSCQKTGYDVLASHISSYDDAVLKPIYRKFETLNNRMLLYLQDEISEIEGQLHELDAAIEQENAHLGKGPASRRLEAKLPSQLQWHRLDLLGRTFAKVEQYNRALTSYSNLVKNLDPASQTDIETYKEWIVEHTPVSEDETNFLQRKDDLLAVKPTSTICQPERLSGAQLDSPIIVLAFAFVSTIIVFKVVPQILARLVISAMVGIASLCTVSPGVPMSIKGLRERRKEITLYSAVMFVLALVVS